MPDLDHAPCASKGETLPLELASLPTVHYGFAALDGPTGPWIVRRVRIEEALSRPFSLEIELATDELEADTEALLGADAELFVDRADVVRSLRGLVASVEYLGVLDDLLHLRVEVVPALALLGHGTNTRAWQDRSVVEVVAEVVEPQLAELGRRLNLDHLTEIYPTREYIVQFRESDLDFVSRLLEAEGITYWFEHDGENGAEVLTFEDGNNYFVELETVTGSPELRVGALGAELAPFECVHEFRWTRELTTTRAMRRTFDWLRPTCPHEVEAPAPGAADSDERGRARELYEHDDLVEPDPQRRLSRQLSLRKQPDRNACGRSNAIDLAPGRIFSLVGHERLELNLEYLVVGVIHEGDCSDVVMTEASGGARYRNRFQCRPFARQQSYRPPASTPPVRIHGPQTAIVTGPEGEEIHTDQYGRIKVRFHWDRQAGLRDDSSLWIRVAQCWAGPGFGTFFVPRVGMEVVVEFLGGDPDRPLVTGCVYNGDNEISVGLPDNKSQSTIRTRSTPNSNGFNELRFEDAAGREQIYVHAQRDYNEVVRSCHSTRVGGHQSNVVGGEQTQTIRGSQGETVHGHQRMTVCRTRTVEVGEDEHNTYRASRSTVVEQNETLEVLERTTLRSGKTVTLEAQEDFVQTVGGSSSVEVQAGPAGPGDSRVSCANDFRVVADNKLFLSQADAASVRLANESAAIEANGSITAKAKSDLKLESEDGALIGAAATTVEFSSCEGVVSIQAGKISITSPEEVSIRVGDSFVKITAAGVQISGTTLELSATAVADISGGIVQINRG